MESGTKLGHFEVLGLLGKGGMGEVWRAKDTKLIREVAIRRFLKRLRRTQPACRSRPLASQECVTIEADQGTIPHQESVVSMIADRTDERLAFFGWNSTQMFR